MADPTHTSRDFSQDKGYRPFSNGTEHHMWLDDNCCRGEKGCRNYRPNAAGSQAWSESFGRSGSRRTAIVAAHRIAA